MLRYKTITPNGPGHHGSLAYKAGTRNPPLSHVQRFARGLQTANYSLVIIMYREEYKNVFLSPVSEPNHLALRTNYT